MLAFNHATDAIIQSNLTWTHCRIF